MTVGREFGLDPHIGITGVSKVHAREWHCFFDLPAFKQGARFKVRASVNGEGVRIQAALSS